MYTRIVELNTKSGKASELTTIINSKVLPILKKQAGFVDETLLVSDADSDRVLALSFWSTREDAERYNREQYPAVHDRRKSQHLRQPTEIGGSTSGSGIALAQYLGACLNELVIG